MAALRVLHRLLTHAGLVHADAQHAVAAQHVVQQHVLLGKAGAPALDDLARPQHVAHRLQHADDEQVIARRDVHAHIDRAALVVLWQAGGGMLAAVDQLERQPGRRLVQPLELELLRPQVSVARAPAQLLDVARQAIGDGLVDVRRVAAPAVAAARHQLVELVALAVGRADYAQLQAGLGNHRKQRLPDRPAVLVKGELVQQHVGRKAPRRVRVGRQRRDLAAAGQLDLQRLDAGLPVVIVRLEARAHRLQVELDALVHRLARLALAPAQNHPAAALAHGLGAHAVQHQLQRAGKGLAALARHHPDFEARVVLHPAALVGVERQGRGGHDALRHGGSRQRRHREAAGRGDPAAAHRAPHWIATAPAAPRNDGVDGHRP